MISAIVDAAGRYYRTVLGALVFLLIFGTFAFVALPKESMPDISFPGAYVSLSYKGLAPEDSCQQLIKPMETELLSISGLKELTATCYEGGANIFLEGESDADVDVFVDAVRVAVDRAKNELPRAADEPRVVAINLSDQFPTLIVTVAGDVPLSELTRLGEDLADVIEELPGVLEVEAGGTRERQTEIVISPSIFEQYALTIGEISTNLTAANATVPAGTARGEGGNTTLSVDTGWDTVADVAAAAARVDGATTLSVAELAEVRETFEDADSVAFANGRRAVMLDIKREAGANLIQMVSLVRETTQSYVESGIANGTWPEDVRISYTQDSSVDVRMLLNSLLNNVAFAVLLVMIVVVTVLGLRTGLLASLAIPGSFVIGFLFLLAGGFTLNIVVLFSLILASGMLVDGAIVVTEYADKRILAGIPRGEAYRLAAKRMAWPIISSTATTLTAFAPLLFWPGQTGEFMKYMPITLLVTLSGSLIMALIFIPVLGERLESFLRFVFIALGVFLLFRGPMGQQWLLLPFAVLATLAARYLPGFILSTGQARKALVSSDGEESMDLAQFAGPVKGYVDLLRGALSMPLVIVSLVFISILAIVMAFGAARVPFGFFPSVEPSTATIDVRARGNLSIEQQVALVSRVEDILLDIQEERGEFHTITTLVEVSNDSGSDSIGTIYLEYTDWEIRDRSAYQINSEIRSRVENLAGLVIELDTPEAGPPVGKGIQIEISSANGDIDLMSEVAASISKRFEDIGLVDIEDGLDVPAAEFKLVPDEAEALRYGIGLSELGTYIQMATDGVVLTSYRPDNGDEQDVILRLMPEYRNISDILNLRIQTPQGAVPISTFVDLQMERRVGTITRIDGKTVMTVAANLDETSELSTSELVEQERAYLQELRDRNLVPAGINLDFVGADREMQDAMAFLTQAFSVAVFIMAVILVTQFNSFYYAGLVLTAVVLAIFGVLLGMVIVPGSQFNLMAQIGVVALAGIVVNNNIVLIDTYIILRRRLEPKTLEENMRVVLLTAAQRLRPVMITTVTTILGLLPMAAGVNIDLATGLVTLGAPSAQWWTDLARAIVFGLTYAALMTLVFTPTMLLLPSFLRTWWRKEEGLRNILQWSGAFSAPLLQGRRA